MQYSPKLKKAMAEIKTILSNHDIAGVVVLHEPGFSEYMMKIDPSYSVAKLNNEGIRVRTKGSGLSAAQKRKKLSDTSNMLNLLGGTTGTMAINLMEVSSVVDRITEADHTGGGHTSQESIDN